MLITQLESMEGDGVLGKPLSTELSLSLHNASATVPCLPYKEKASNHAMSSFPAIAPSMSLLSPTQFSTVDERCSRPASYPLELLPQLTPNRVSISSSTSWEQPTIPLVFSHLFPAGAMDMNQPPVSVDRKVATPESTSSLTVQRVGRTSGIGNLFNMIKRERERSSSDAEEQERTCEVSSRGSDEDGEGGASGPRKKLRLSKEQSMLLEQSFKEHSTLNPKQKAELAKQLKLRPRQVEVWFQNRRARTKLKQTEVDCELLKRCYESLTEENRRLQKEVKELRAFKAAPPWVNVGHDLSYMPLPAATLTMCPSCERIATHGPDNSLTTLGFAGAILKAGPSSSAARAPTNLHLEVHQHHSFPELPPPRQPLSSAAC